MFMILNGIQSTAGHERNIYYSLNKSTEKNLQIVIHDKNNKHRK